MQATPDHVEMLLRIQRLQPGEALTGRPQLIQDLARAGLVRTAQGAVAITLDGTLWLAQNKHLFFQAS